MSAKTYSTDTYTQLGAQRLANTIMRVWRKRGHSNVFAEIFAIDPKAEKIEYGIRSNLIAGLPPKLANAIAA